MVVDLVEGGRAFGAVSAAASGVEGVAFYAVNLLRFVVNVAEQTAGGFAVEAGGGDECVVLGFFCGPCLGVEGFDVVPVFVGWIGVKVCHSVWGSG